MAVAPWMTGKGALAPQRSFNGWRLYPRQECVRCVLQNPMRFPLIDWAAGRLPPPQEIFWPRPYDFDGARGFLTLIQACDIKRIEETLRLWPAFNFGIGDFYKSLRDLADRRVQMGEISLPEGPTDSIEPLVGGIVKKLKVREFPFLGRLKGTLYACLWTGGEETMLLEVSFGAKILSEVALDPKGRKASLKSHRPGGYRALGVDPRQLERLIKAS